jgi:hypothetical protein
MKWLIQCKTPGYADLFWSEELGWTSCRFAARLGR